VLSFSGLCIISRDNANPAQPKLGGSPTERTAMRYQ
jgi:hypothetical protein